MFQCAFFAVGVDHIGSLFIKSQSQRIERNSLKVWILFFVCAAIRAVHVELVSSTSTEDFRLAWRRFSARYGMPRIVRSDNAAGFVAASRQLPVVWKFNPPAAPLHGGFMNV